MSATASGADKGDAQRRCTPEQKAAVLRIRRCNPTAFYDILELESVRTTASESDIKKAYRKLSLLTHPDKNGHEHADEAFKMVSRAFGVLGDKEKREKYDRFGTDPDSRFASAQQQNPFSGFARRNPAGAGPGGGGFGGGFQEEMTPEEMFQRFFGGGFGGPFGGFDTGPQFVFNFGGGPGIRVHQFGGARPRRRPREANDNQNEGGGFLQTIIGLLPILIFFLIPLLNSIFSGSGTTQPSGPRMVFDQPMPPYTEKRQTPNFKVDYFVNPVDIQSYSKNKLSQLDKTAESNLLRVLRSDCESEYRTKQRMIDEAHGWIFPDQKKLETANAYEMPTCKRLEKMGVRR
ncbi:hypothetical protein jhhlp_005638 [Lomentospora prolificans]|uniref:J domain-containing protein n=1 Tax=Lomentospora prolificans TaxID=41688 RepID=A0A2N3N3M8_9PEZI|nr:hypothetical protein jhhlp_005638 [Lomentospora prolificans]